MNDGSYAEYVRGDWLVKQVIELYSGKHRHRLMQEVKY